MDRKIKVGVLKETKNPPDRRVPVPPDQAVELINKYPNVDLFVQESGIRCFTDDEYRDRGINVVPDMNECDILLGVKEVNIPELIPGKAYLFFSHTTKKQPYNKELLQEILKREITLIDYEHLTDTNNFRLIAFGRWAGVVGAYNGLIGYGRKTGSFDLKRASECHDMKEMIGELKKIKLPPVKILITGKGRVGMGAMETLQPLNLREVTSEEFINGSFDEPVLCQIDADEYVQRKDGQAFDFQHFFGNPGDYVSTFLPYTKVADIYIASHFWHPQSPVFMTRQDMQADDFNISVIADISCDIKNPIPSTLRASTIADPFYGYDPVTDSETEPYTKSGVTVMAIDNLPGELPRDASKDFGNGLLERIFPSLFGDDSDKIIERAMITRDGRLTEKYAYLQDFADGRE